ncbi:porin family protein [Desulfopila sp. IMCC35006]|uniref:outer membrane protein n=1 Tax=Desulfopila sp. IMCC35006 TaxID=2569542 RepID=UPI0010AC1EB7|nr:outer membrane beta-barrel protein [Desulfopila sp. IMCC35006]TKB28064.1 porin family protein [Desulfopila sp. IMCC35006]
MKKTYLVMTGCLMLAAASPALAADGLYMGFEGGASFLNDADFVGTGQSTGLSYTTEYDTGYVIGGFLGYQYQYMRIEAELAYRQNDLDDLSNVTVANVGTVPSFAAAGIGISGETNAFSAMVNGYLDIHNSSPFTPSIMAGIGFANVELNDVSFSSPSVTLSAVDEDDTVFAWQVGAGLSYAFNEMVSLSIDYRYFATSDPQFADVDLEYDSHNIMARVLYHF